LDPESIVAFDEFTSVRVVELSSPRRAHDPVLAVPVDENVAFPTTVIGPFPAPGLVMEAPAGEASANVRTVAKPTIVVLANNLRTDGILLIMILLGKTGGA
jgi:hypothetical protein